MSAWLSVYVILFNLIDHRCIGYIVDCTKSTEQCTNTTVHCADNTDCSISCQQPHNCMDSTLICPKMGNCLISCSSYSSCQSSHIVGPMGNYHLTVHCVGKHSCLNTIVDGSTSSTLTITGCVADGSCYDLSVYCPTHNDKGSKNCFIHGNNNLGSNGMEGQGTQLYAVNSWHDIEISYTGSFSTFHRGIMYCGDRYNRSCNIAADDWSCSDFDEECIAMNVYMISTQQNKKMNDTTVFIYEEPAGEINYIFVGAWVLALAFAYIVCRGTKHALKSAVRKKVRQQSMSLDTDSDQAEVVPDGRIPTVTVNCQ
eukprot:284009_1